MTQDQNETPRAHAVHADPSVRSVEADPLPEKVCSAPETKSPAKWAYERLILYIKNFEDQLDADHEVAIGFTGSSAGVLRIEGIGYFDPDIVTFYGSDGDGTRTQLIQHVSQLNVILRALPLVTEGSPARRIGFRLV
ncbi:DUF6173 family protein, partial [Tropicimonas sp. TH_r6]|uniref:DUF6173 family protein n=1 Tax=Tropicimonas sp. TH_r6 TaxID=3082085 RepID=UPI002952D7DC